MHPAVPKLCVSCSAFVIVLAFAGCGSQSGNSGSSPPPPQTPSISLNQTSVTLTPGSTTQFTATVRNETNKSVGWSVDSISGGNSSVGTISSSGLYTAPSSTGTHTITASIVAAPSYTAKASVNVFTLSVSPASAYVGAAGTQQFTSNIQGTNNLPVSWSVDGVTGGNSNIGTITTAGLYTAPASIGAHTVTASTAAPAPDSANASVNVFTVSLSPTSATLAPAGTQQFTATVQGISNTAVSWSVDGVAGGSSTTGTISTSGLYTAPNALGGHTISAVSAVSASGRESAPLTVLNVAPNAVLTYHNDDARDGAYTEETTLTPSNVNSTQFGKIISYPVDGQIYSQPLYLPQVSINGGTSDVVFVATQNNSLYAFDADATTQPTTFWQDNFGTPLTVNDQYGPWPAVGILSTPVIDVTTNTIYVVADEVNAAPQFQLHALDVTTGSEKFNGPVGISATYSGETIGNSCYQRMGLALNPVTNFLYIAFGSCPNGWLLAYNKTSLEQVAVFDVTAGAGGGGLWSGAPAIDDITGDVYLMSGTDAGDEEWINGSTMVGYNDSFLRLDPNQLTVLDYFAPDDNYTLATNDVDLGAGGNVIVPGSSSYPHEVLGGGKDGNIFVINRDSMGGFNDSTNNVLQTVHTGTQEYNNIFSTPVYWNGNIYYHPNADVLHAFSWAAGADAGQQLANSPTSSGSTVFNTHGATPSLSASGNNNAIIWEIDNSAYVGTNPSSSGPAVLHALDATNVANELYNSTQAGTRDTAGLALKFTVPTIANGRVFVPTGSELDIYGLLAPQ